MVVETILGVEVFPGDGKFGDYKGDFRLHDRAETWDCCGSILQLCIDAPWLHPKSGWGLVGTMCPTPGTTCTDVHSNSAPRSAV